MDDHDPRLTQEQCTHREKSFPAFASMGMLFGYRIIDPISFAIVVLMQSSLVFPGYQRLFRVFR
jgi:uncharacterized membrane protein